MIYTPKPGTATAGLYQILLDHPGEEFTAKELATRTRTQASGVPARLEVAMRCGAVARTQHSHHDEWLYRYDRAPFAEIRFKELTRVVARWAA